MASEISVDILGIKGNRTVKSDEHSAKLLTDLKEFCPKKLFDYVLVAGGKKIHVNKNLMALSSDYFSALTTSEWKENVESILNFDALDHIGLKAAVDFVYTGKVKVNKDNLESVIQAASYLQIPTLLDALDSFLVKLAKVTNCVDLLNFVKDYSVDTKLVKFAALNITSLTKEQYTALSLTHFKLILGSNSLKMDSELHLVPLIKDWMEKNKSVKFRKGVTVTNVEDEPWAMFADLMALIRWPLIGVDNLKKLDPRIHKLMCQIPKCDQLLNDAQEYHTQIHKQPLLQSSRTRVRCNGQCLVTVDEQVRGMAVLNLENKRLTQPLPSTDGTHSSDSMVGRTHIDMRQSTVCVNNFLYVCGGSDIFGMGFAPHSRCYRYDPRFNMWIEISDMLMPRKEFVLLNVTNKLYSLCGLGFDESPIMENECYDIESNTWTDIPNLSLTLSNHAGCVVNDTIYVSGGETAVAEGKTPFAYGPRTNVVFKFDIGDQKWNKCASMQRVRSRHIMANVRDDIFVIGGGSMIEKYCVSTDQWTVCNQILPDFMYNNYDRSINIWGTGYYVKDNKIHFTSVTFNDFLLDYELVVFSEDSDISTDSSMALRGYIVGLMSFPFSHTGPAKTWKCGKDANRRPGFYVVANRDSDSS